MENEEQFNLMIAKKAAKLFGWLTHTDWHEWLGESWLLVAHDGKNNIRQIIGSLFYSKQVERDHFGCIVFTDLGDDLMNTLFQGTQYMNGIEKITTLQDILQNVDNNTKQILEMRFSGYHSKEIGDKLNLTPENVRQKLSRSLQYLRENFSNRKEL